jgi:galactose mutarotase-like enzyme
MDLTVLCNDAVRVAIADRGAEMHSFSFRGSELLWSGDVPWEWHAPTLFPIIGRLPDDKLVTASGTRDMPIHGFGRHTTFERHSAASDRCEFTLSDTERTRVSYPHAFTLRVSYRLRRNGVIVTFDLRNPGKEALMAALGAHPGFVSPLPGGSSPTHSIELGDLANQPFFRARGGMLLPGRDPADTPTSLRPVVDLTSGEAMVFCSAARRGSVLYGGDAPYALRVSWRGFQYVGIWSQAPERFVCIEPWSTLPPVHGWEDDWSTLPGLVRLAPRRTQSFSYTLSVESPAAKAL